MYMATWIGDLYRTTYSFTKDSTISYLSFRNEEKISVSKSAQERFGALTNDQWVPKSDILDPQIQQKIVDSMKTIFTNYINDLKLVSTEKGEEAVRSKAQKKIIAVFERKFGTIPVLHDFKW